jgi:hypothetical protein
VAIKADEVYYALHTCRWIKEWCLTHLTCMSHATRFWVVSMTDSLVVEENLFEDHGSKVRYLARRSSF